MSVQVFRFAGFCAFLLAAGCSVVLPLDDEYTFGEPVDVVCEIPTESEVCAGHCGQIVVCDTQFACGGCAGELACSTENVCQCDSSPCALVQTTAGDANIQRIVDVAVDRNGNVFFAGVFRGTVTFGDDTYTNPGASRDDIFLVKMSPAGNVLWSRAYGDVTSGMGDTEQEVSAIAVDSLGNVVLAGDSYLPIDLGNGEVPTDNGIFLVKLDKDGNHVFSASHSTDYTIDARDLAIDPATQDLVLTGNFWGTLTIGATSITAVGTNSDYDIFLARFAADGTPKALMRYGDGAEQMPEALTIGGGYLYLSASFSGTFNFGSPNPTNLSTAAWYSLALTQQRLSGTGFSHSWSRQYGTDVARSRLVADTEGNVFVAGSFDGSVEIDDPPLDSAQGSTFLAKIDASGSTVWAQQFAGIDIMSLGLGPDGSVYVVGDILAATTELDLGGGPVSTTGTIDPFIARYDADGAHAWSRVFGASVGTQRAAAVAVMPEGDAWLGMNFDGQIDPGLGEEITQGGTDIAVIRYTP